MNEKHPFGHECSKNFLFSELTDSNVNFYKCSGLISAFLDEVTNYNDDFQFHANLLGFEELKELSMLSIQAMFDEEKSWNFLSNGW